MSGIFVSCHFCHTTALQLGLLLVFLQPLGLLKSELDNLAHACRVYINVDYAAHAVHCTYTYAHVQIAPQKSLNQAMRGINQVASYVHRLRVP